MDLILDTKINHLREMYEFVMETILNTRKLLHQIGDEILKDIWSKNQTLKKFDSQKLVFNKNNNILEIITKAIKENLCIENLEKFVENETKDENSFVEFPEKIRLVILNDSRIFILAEPDIIYIFTKKEFKLEKTLDFYYKKISCIQANNDLFVILFEDAEIYFYLNFQVLFLVKTVSNIKDAKLTDCQLITINQNLNSYLIDLKDFRISAEFQVQFDNSKSLGMNLFEVNQVEVSDDYSLVAYGSTLLQQVSVYSLKDLKLVNIYISCNLVRSFCFCSNNDLFLVDFNFELNVHTNDIKNNSLTPSIESTKSEEAANNPQSSLPKNYKLNSPVVVSDIKCESVGNHIFVYGQNNKISVHTKLAGNFNLQFCIDEGQVPIKVFEDAKFQRFLIICRSGEIFSKEFHSKDKILLKINKSIHVSFVCSFREYFLAGSTQGDIFVYFHDLELLKILTFHTSPIKLIKDYLKSFYSFAENSFLVEWDSKSFEKIRVFTEFPKIESILPKKNLMIFKKLDGEIATLDLQTKIEKRYKSKSKYSRFSLFTHENSKYFAYMDSKGKMVLYGIDGSVQDSKEFQYGTEILHITSNDVLILIINDHLCYYIKNTEPVTIAKFKRSELKDSIIYNDSLFFLMTNNFVRVLNLSNGEEHNFTISSDSVITKLFISENNLICLNSLSQFTLYSLKDAKTKNPPDNSQCFNFNEKYQVSGHLNGYLVITSKHSKKILFSKKLPNSIKFLEISDSLLYASCTQVFLEVRIAGDKFYSRVLDYQEIPEKYRIPKVLENFEEHLKARN